MSNFKTIEKLGLTIFDYKEPHHHFAVDAEELEALLQSAQVVYGVDGNWTTTQWEDDKVTGLVIGITPIKKKTKAEAALELLGKLANDPAYYSSLAAAEAKQILEMKDEGSHE